ncbi:hypothetical protein BH10BAC5_BH10BAC5_28660 [soil metagenome]
MNYENNSLLLKFFIGAVFLLIFPVYLAVVWFHSASVSVDSAEALFVFKNTFFLMNSFWNEIWLIITVSFVCCLGTAYFTVRSIKHKNYWIRNISLVLMLLAIFFALLDIKWLFYDGS